MKLLISLFVLSLFGCGGKGLFNAEQLKEQIIRTDKEMSRSAATVGFNSSLLANSDIHMVKLSEGFLPVLGKEAFKKSFDKSKDIRTISWIPVNAEVARSGELGYTWGNWKFIAKDTVFYGNYFTIWKKQSDGTWKVALDGGNNTPKPGN